MSILSIYTHLKNQPLLKMFCLYAKFNNSTDCSGMVVAVKIK